ncbi:MAG: MBL fold metallo-hydrolase, partial [Lachnospiraceae bacterium]
MNKVTYISHSGYMIETRNAVFIFDYYKGTLPEFSKEKDLYIFASHTHFDHFKKKIFQITKEGTPIQFILSDDINKSVVKSKEAAMVMANQITFMGPNEVQTIGDCQVRTLRSTDEGVAFLIHTTDLCIYHGGDLNWWHWNQENDIFNEMMKRKFQYEINKLADETIDFAFLPLDSR